MASAVASNLAPLIPAAFVGSRGELLTPEQIEREREIAAALAQRGDPAFQDAGWLGVIGRGLEGAVSGWKETRANRAEQENNAYSRELIERALSGGVGGSTAMTPALSGASPVAATAPAASSEPLDYASQRVSQAHGDMGAYRDAIASIESAGSGDYQAVGPAHPTLGRALGRYQVMEANVGPWTEKYLGRRLTPEEFLANPEAQDAVFDGEFGSYVQRFGDPAIAAQAWFAGPGGVGTERQDSLGTSVPEYAQKFTTALGRTPAQDAIQAQLESLPVGGSMTMPTPDQMATGSTQPSPVAMALAPQAAPPAPVQVAQAGGGINPAIIEALSSPYVNDQTRQIASLLLQQQMQAQDPMRALELQIAQEKLNQLRNPQPEITAEMQNLQWRAAQAGLQPGTPEYAEFMLSGGKGPLVNVDVGGGEKFGEEFAKGDAQALAEVSQAGLAAQRNIARIDRLGEILAQTPQGAMASWQQIAGQYGINTEGLDNIQAAQALINSLVPEQRPPGSGPMSDADLELFKQSLPRIINQPNGNQIILNTMRAIAQYDAEGASIVQQLRRGEIDRATAFDMLQSRQNPLAGLDDITKRNGSSDTPPPGVDPADWQYMTPEERALFQ